MYENVIVIRREILKCFKCYDVCNSQMVQKKKCVR